VAGIAAAIKTITNMVLVSLDPFASRRLLLVIVALLGFSALCFADPVLMAQRYASSPAERSTHLKPDGRELPGVNGVDLPPRARELLPSGNAAETALFPPADLFFSTLESIGSTSV
jgi:hypothetical protein